MQNWSPSHRPAKDVCRQIVTKFSERPARSVLFMPAAEALDIAMAQRYGLVLKSPQTRFLCVEQNRATFRAMQQSIKRLGLGIDVEGKDCINTPLDQVQVDRQFDFAWFDFNGAINSRTALWMINFFERHMTPTANIAISLQGAARRCDLAKACREFFFDPARGKYMFETTRAFGVSDETQAVYLATVLHLFGNRRFEVYLVEHTDTMRMFTFCLAPTKYPEYTIPYYGEFTELVLGQRRKLWQKQQLRLNSESALSRQSKRVVKTLSKPSEALRPRKRGLLAGLTASNSNHGQQAEEQRKAVIARIASMSAHEIAQIAPLVLG